MNHASTPQSSADHSSAPHDHMNSSGQFEARSAPTVELSSEPPQWRSYVAIGDSFSEGLWDVAPENPDVCRGWADMLALTLSSRRQAAGLSPLSYANLAIRGRLLRPIISEQLPRALDMSPDLISIIGGGNDILRPAVDVDLIAAHLDHAVAQARATGADVLLATGTDFSGRGSLAFTRSRTAIFNSHIWSIAQRHGAYVANMWGHRTISDPRMWAEDRIHLTTQGHRRVADMALVGLGLQPEDPGFDAPLDDPQPKNPRVRARENIVWAREHVGPWIKRRLTGTSTGDTRVAKYPTLEPID